MPHGVTRSAAVADEHDEHHCHERHDRREMKHHKSLLAARRSAYSGARSYKAVARLRRVLGEHFIVAPFEAERVLFRQI